MHISGLKILFIHKNHKIISFSGKWLELELLQLSEIQPDLKQEWHDFTHIWNLKNKNESRLGQLRNK
jgi:hypothetical protein